MEAKVLQLNPIKIEIELVIAQADDLKEVDYFKDLGYGAPKQKVMKMSLGIPYWLINSKGEIEPKPYKTSENSDAKEIAFYLKEERLLIAKNPFK